MTSVLVLGATGMLGNAVFRFMSQQPGLDVHGTTRSSQLHHKFPVAIRSKLIDKVSAEEFGSLCSAIAATSAQVVINCVGVVKQLSAANDPLSALPINSILPHQLAGLCETQGARLIHISTDCVFDGSRGSYREEDLPDCVDLYGRSKLLGEVDFPHAITLRTSLIGRELCSSHGLIDWFLSQEGPVTGYRKAVFSGLPTVELARIITQYILPQRELSGIYHVSAEPINKHDLLTLVAKAYAKPIEIVPDEAVVIDRSLISDRFRQATGYAPAAWPDLVSLMRDFN